jgi:hypothetical protein
MTVIVTALGLFYMLAAALVLRRVRMEWLLDGSIETLSGKPKPDRIRIAVIAASALLYGAAGLALVLGSGFAVWLLGGGLLAQTLYYGAVWLRLNSDEDDSPERWRKAWHAAIISTAAFAIAAYAARIGVLA